MCPGNRAAAATTWVNSQLKALWELADECVEKQQCRGLKSSNLDVTYSTCLSQFGVGKHLSKPAKEDLSFFTTFKAPTVTFICNHELLLEFKPEAGHLKHGKKSSIDTFHGTCAFRVPFRQEFITRIGQTDILKAKFLILDLDAAVFVRERSQFQLNATAGVPENRMQDAIVKYLRIEYMNVLHKAGFHFIYLLPDFNALSRAHHFDFSLLNDVNDVLISNLFGIEIDAVNSSLRGRWFEAAACIDEFDDDLDWSRLGEFVLAEHRSSYNDYFFHTCFGPPEIRVLCPREVVFLIEVQELNCYLDGKFSEAPEHQFSGWTIAVVVDIHHEWQENIQVLWLDFSTARFCKDMSFFGETTVGLDASLFSKICDLFASYVISRYLVSLKEHGYHYIYRQFEFEEHDIDFEVSDGYNDRLRITDTFGFDILTVVTQGSLNYGLRCLWKASQAANKVLHKWTLDSSFEASFAAPQIQLPHSHGSDSVILYLTVLEGTLTLLNKSTRGEEDTVFDWRFAFEVKLKEVDSEASPLSDGSLAARGHHSHKQLILDFTTSKFRQDLSSLPGFFDDSNYMLMRSKRRSLIHYLRKYMQELMSQDYHVLYSIPVWKEKQSSPYQPSSYAPSSFSHQFYGANQNVGLVSNYFGRRFNSDSHNMIVMCAMFDHSTRPSSRLPPSSWQWISSSDAFAGTIAIPRAIFLDGWLLQELKGVNRRTTLIPEFHGIGDRGMWDFDLIPLEGHRWVKNWSEEWQPVRPASQAGLEFHYQSSDVWTYKHESDRVDIHNGFYSVSCATTNKLFIPTIYKHGVCEIKMHGRVELSLKFEGFQKKWSTTAATDWFSTIIIANDVSGLGLTITPSFKHELQNGSGFIDDYNIVNPRIKDASTWLKEKMATMEIIREETINEFQSSFCDRWALFYSGTDGYTLRNPVFNLNGDILFDLQSSLDAQGQNIGSERSRMSVASNKSGTTPQSGPDGTVIATSPKPQSQPNNPQVVSYETGDDEDDDEDEDGESGSSAGRTSTGQGVGARQGVEVKGRFGRVDKHRVPSY